MRYLRIVPLLLLALVGLVLLSPWSGAHAVVDSDGDGYDDTLESYLGTDPLSNCPTTSGTDAWPPDVDRDGFVWTLDVVQLTPPTYGARAGGGAFSTRYDFNADGMIGALDAVQIQEPMLGSTCSSQFVPAPGGTISEVAIDMDTAGNDAQLTQGADVQMCGAIDSSGTNTIDIDVIVPSSSAGIRAWEFLLNYDPAVVNVTAEQQMLLSGGSDPLPDASGSWRSGAFEGLAWWGPAVLTRITLTGVAPGTSPLTLTKVGAINSTLGPIQVLAVSDAKVVVDSPWPVPAGDGDCDGFTDGDEAFMGTDSVDDCPDSPDDDAWPADMASGLPAPNGGFGKHDGVVDILDIVQLTPPFFNSSPPDPNYLARKDFNADGSIDILDMVRLTPPVFNTSCAP